MLIDIFTMQLFMLLFMFVWYYLLCFVVDNLFYGDVPVMIDLN